MSKIGILDVLGENPNPFTNQPYSENYKQKAKYWSALPAYEMADTIIETIRANQVVLVVSGTGSGKTVLLPKFAAHVLDYKGKVAVTLPKQIIAKSSAEFAAELLDVKLGKQVGYQYKGSPKGSKSEDTKILYATDGTIVQRLLNDPELRDFDIVIIDEAHERKIQIDFLLYLLKNAISLREDLKVIIMSATINSDIFKSYFIDNRFKEINVGGKTNYPIKSVFLNEATDYNGIILKGFEILARLLTEETGDILFFITSQAEAFDMCKKLDNIKKKGNIFCVEVYAGMDPERQELAQDKDKYKKGSFDRKVIFATNVAESSLTIDGIMWVIDTGYELKSSYDPGKRAKVLERQLITMAQAKQRMGRTGRTGPGTCYHLYTQDEFENRMVKFPEPDIRTSDITSECLRLLALSHIKTSEKLLNVLTKLIEPPREIYIRDALAKLMQMGLIENGTITKVGMMVNKISNEPMIGKTLLYSIFCNCKREVINIMALLDASSSKMSEIFTIQQQLNRIRYQNKNDPEKMKRLTNELTNKFKNVQKKFKHKYGDFNSLLKIYENYRQHSNNDKYCENNFLKRSTLSKARKYSYKIASDIDKYKGELENESLMNELGINKDILNHDIHDRIIYCFLNGFYINRASVVSKIKKSYQLVNANGKAEIEKMSFVYSSKNIPTNVIYSEYFMMLGNASLNIVSKIPTHIDKMI